MKRLKMILSDFRESLGANLVLLFVMTAVIFLFLYTYGQYRFSTHNYNVLRKNLSNFVYFEDFVIDFGGEESYKETMEVVNQINEFDAVKTAYYYLGAAGFLGDLRCNVSVYNEDIRKLCPEPEKGEWFTQGKNEDGSFNVVVAGSDFYNAKVGSEYTFYIGLPGTEQVEVKIRICGVMGFPCYFPNFNGGGTFVGANKLFTPGDCIIFDNEAIQFIIDARSEMFHGSMNRIVEFEPDASEEEIEECLQYFSSRGTYHDEEEILNQSREDLAYFFKTAMLFPLFLLFTAGLTFLSISTLSVYKKIDKQAVYYLVGCSKKRILADVLIQIGIVSFVSGLLNILFALSYSFLRAKQIILMDNVLFDSQVIWVTIGILLFIYALTAMTVVLILRKKSPVALLRKFEN